ncbi:HAD family acid phosphatase [Edaphobacter aggregans]|uniref:HAD family acid phosphatase n=1 Tax=Edaphobacter aggregans TaxID=570835 RepID=UPI00069068B8|nr:HAD family acid phosphatase [Edaphobacter aggregans]
MTCRLLILIAALCQISTAGIAQDGKAYTIPVVCKASQDKPDPPHTPGSHDQKPGITAAEANTIVETSRQRRDFLSAPELENISILRYQLMEYANCADSAHCYWRDLQSQLNRARAELKRLVATRKPNQNLAMVLDIDETSLSNYCELKREGFDYIADQYNRYLVSTEASIAIPGTLQLYNDAIAAGVSVFFITGRANNQYEATVRNLHLAGYNNWNGLILRNNEELTMDTTYYKSSERAKIAADHRIILSVGDQWSDLNGTPSAEVSVKLPNPFYFLP